MDEPKVTLSISIPKRWLQFRLKTILVLTFVVAVALGVWVATRDHQIAPLALGGHCPVSLANTYGWKKGDVRFEAVHEGMRYRFAGEPECKEFLIAPDKYCVAASGIDVVLAKNTGRIEFGFREFGFRYDGRVFVFSSKATKKEFANTPSEYATFASDWTRKQY
jgi:YHS domain-containing protein